MEATKKTSRELLREALKEKFPMLSEKSQKQFEDGMMIYIGEEDPTKLQGKSQREIIQEQIQKRGDKLSKEEQKQMEDIFIKVFEGNMTPKDAMGMTKEMMEVIYSYAYQQYTSGKYNDALLVFRYLKMLDNKDVRFPMGLAACYCKQKDYPAALYALELAAYLDLTSPIPMYHMADCYIKLNNIEMAAIHLQMTIDIAEKDPIYLPIQQRAELMLEGIISTHPDRVKRKKGV